MSDKAEWEEHIGERRCTIWSRTNGSIPTLLITGTREELDGRWNAIVAAFPDAWMTESECVSRTRVVKGVRS